MADKAEKTPKADATENIETTELTENVEYVVSEPKVKRGVDLTKFNTLSIVSIATAASGFGAVAGIISGHVALSQLKRTDERGRGLALTGVILGYGYLAFGLGSMILGSVLRLRGIEFGQGNRMGDHQGNFGFDMNQNGQGMMGDNDGDRGFGPGQGGHMGQFGPDQNGQMGQMGQIDIQVPVQPGMPIPTPAATN